MIDITGLNKAQVLKALHDGSKAQGMSFLHLRSLSLQECKDIIETMQAHGDRLWFDYLAGKVMKVDISGDQFDPWGYDRDNGDGAAERVINYLRQEQQAA